MTTRTTTAFLVVAVSLVLTACDGGSTEPAATTIPAPATSEAATADPIPTTAAPADDIAETTTEPALSEAEQDELDIATTLEKYEAARMAAMRGDASIEEIYPYASGTAREQWVTQLMSYEAQELTITGETTLEVGDVSVDGDSAEVVACLDVSTFDALDESGESIVAEDRLDQTSVDYVLERADSAEHGWLLTEDVNRDEPCDG